MDLPPLSFVRPFRHAVPFGECVVSIRVKLTHYSLPADRWRPILADYIHPINAFGYLTPHPPRGDLNLNPHRLVRSIAFHPPEDGLARGN